VGKYTPIILLAAAIVVALVTSVGTYRWLQEKKEVKVVQSVETVPVAVAIVDMGVGTLIKKEMVKTISFMKGSLAEGSYYSDVSALEGRVVYSPIRANEPVLQSRLAAETITQGGMPAVIKDKKRAMSVKVDQIIGVSGFIKPGDRVDVLLTTTDPETKAAITKIVLENMLVLATGTQVQSGQQGPQAAPVNVITLEVTPVEAEKVALATSKGKIQLALRGGQDHDEVFTKGATIRALLASYRIGASDRSAQQFRTTVKAAAPAKTAGLARPVSAGRAYSVWTVNGNAVQRIKIK
jgi:pilus assembly protein CpaB